MLHNIEVLSKEFVFFFNSFTSVERSLAQLGEIACVIKNITSNIIWFDYFEYSVRFSFMLEYCINVYFKPYH